MRTNLSCCLGLIDNGQYKSTNRLLVVVPHERSHAYGIMRILKNLRMLPPKALKTRAIKDTMTLVADSIGGTKGAPAPRLFIELRSFEKCEFYGALSMNIR